MKMSERPSPVKITFCQFHDMQCLMCYKKQSPNRFRSLNQLWEYFVEHQLICEVPIRCIDCHSSVQLRSVQLWNQCRFFIIFWSRNCDVRQRRHSREHRQKLVFFTPFNKRARRFTRCRPCSKNTYLLRHCVSLSFSTTIKFTLVFTFGNVLRISTDQSIWWCLFLWRLVFGICYLRNRLYWRNKRDHVSSATHHWQRWWQSTCQHCTPRSALVQSCLKWMSTKCWRSDVVSRETWRRRHGERLLEGVCLWSNYDEAWRSFRQRDVRAHDVSNRSRVHSRVCSTSWTRIEVWIESSSLLRLVLSHCSDRMRTSDW